MTSARQSLARAVDLQVTGAEPTLRVTRRRKLPSRGVFRLLIPRAVAIVDVSAPVPRVSVVPDGVAWLMVVICIGGVVVEATMDRVRFPREYPPAFVFGIAAFYVVALVIELMRTRDAVSRAIREARAPNDVHGGRAGR